MVSPPSHYYDLDEEVERALRTPGAGNRYFYSGMASSLTEMVSCEGRFDLLAKLLQAGIATDLTRAFAVTPSDECIDMLLKAGVVPTVNKVSRAMADNRMDRVFFYLRHGADSNAEVQISDRLLGVGTLLHVAAGIRDPDDVVHLLAAGATVDARNGFQMTPLMHAIDRNSGPISQQIVTLLLEHGADPNAVDKFGETPLILAARVGCREAVPLLLAAGAHRETKSGHGLTAWEYAQRRGDTAMASLLQP